MKKILGFAVTAAAALALASCASNGGSSSGSKSGTPYTIKDGDGVVGYYTFDEGVEDNEVIDHSGNDLSVSTGALDGSETVEGHEGLALKFNGEDEYITLEPEVLDGDGFTFAAWVKPAQLKIWSRIFDLGDTKKDVFVAFDGRIPNTVGMREESSEKQVNCPLPIPGKWTHFAATFGDGKLTLYINGKDQGNIECSITPEEVAANAQGLYVGRSNWAPDPLFEGAMDDILVASRVFSAAEIAQVYNGVVAPAAEAE